jgi:hypothetical protein
MSAWRPLLSGTALVLDQGNGVIEMVGEGCIPGVEWISADRSHLVSHHCRSLVPAHDRLDHLLPANRRHEVAGKHPHGTGAPQPADALIMQPVGASHQGLWSPRVPRDHRRIGGAVKRNQGTGAAPAKTGSRDEIRQADDLWQNGIDASASRPQPADAATTPPAQIRNGMLITSARWVRWCGQVVVLNERWI